MKRDDALWGIKKIISENFSEHPLEHGEIAEKILTFLESDVKMVPPSIYLKAFNRYDNGWEDE